MWHIVDVSNISTNIFFTFPLEFVPNPQNYPRKTFAVYTVNKSYISGVCIEYILLSSTGEYPDIKIHLYLHICSLFFYTWLT